MDQPWYFMDGQTRKGPFSTEDLLPALLTMAEPRLTKVWREGMPDWVRAGALPEFSGKLPPRAPSGSAYTDREQPRGAQSLEVGGQARAVGTLYRRLILLVGVQLIIGLVVKLIPVSGASELDAAVGIFGFSCILVTDLFIVITAYQLMKSLGSGAAVLWALAMFIPLLNILFLLRISSKAQTWCKDRGIAVGFFGPTRESLDRLNERPRGTA